MEPNNPFDSDNWLAQGISGFLGIVVFGLASQMIPLFAAILIGCSSWILTASALKEESDDINQ